MNVHFTSRNLNYYTSRNSYLAAKEIYFIPGAARCLIKLKRSSPRRPLSMFTVALQQYFDSNFIQVAKEKLFI